ncbi:hypothetical protein [Erwinia sp. E_sp_W01_1]
MPVFNSFWQAGYEGADHRNRPGDLLSMNDITGHNQKLKEDYNALKNSIF